MEVLIVILFAIVVSTLIFFSWEFIWATKTVSLDKLNKEKKYGLIGLGLGFASQIYRFSSVDKYGGIENIALLILLAMLLTGWIAFIIGKVNI